PSASPFIRPIPVIAPSDSAPSATVSSVSVRSTPASAPSTPIDILRFNTCGSVDDGKSTLIGRLLFDSKNIMEDQLEALERSADITGGGQINLANSTAAPPPPRDKGIPFALAPPHSPPRKPRSTLATPPGPAHYPP